MRLLNMEKYDDSFFVVIERAALYDQLRITKTSMHRISSFPRKEYRDLEHFAGVMGKFNPYFEILQEPLPLKKITYAELLRIYPDFMAAKGEAPPLDE